jgi:FixJ family two-component response regulator
VKTVLLNFTSNVKISISKKEMTMAKEMTIAVKTNYIKVVIMEDIQPTRSAMVKAIEEYRYRENRFVPVEIDDPRIVMSRYRDSCFILDIQMEYQDNGERKCDRYAGIELCRQIKEKNPDACVIIYSGRVDMESVAMKAGANLFYQKTSNTAGDCEKILAYLCNELYRKDNVNLWRQKVQDRDITPAELEKELDRQRDYFEKCFDLKPDPTSDYSPLDSEYQKNLESYKCKSNDPNWVSQWKGQHVAFVDGKHVESNSDVSELLKTLRKVTEYKEKQKLVVKVKDEYYDDDYYDIMEEPASQWLDIEDEYDDD